jgi:hypothetical protein
VTDTKHRAAIFRRELHSKEGILDRNFGLPFHVTSSQGLQVLLTRWGGIFLKGILDFQPSR